MVTKMRKTKEEAEKTREKILATAVQVFNEKGFTATRLEDIARAAGVTRGAIYWHFENKEDIIMAICRNNKSQTMNLINKMLEEEKNPLVALKKGLSEYFKRIYSDNDFRQIEEIIFKSQMKGELDFIKQVKMQEDRQDMDMLQDILKKSQQLGYISQEINIELATKSIACSFFGALAATLTHPHMLDFNGMENEFIELLFKGIEIKL